MEDEKKYALSNWNKEKKVIKLGEGIIAILEIYK